MTKETEVTAAPEPVLASRDREDESAEQVEIVEDVEIVEPEDEPISAADSDDPRADIYKRHAKNREQEIAQQVGDDEETSENALESGETTDIIDEGEPEQTDTREDSDDLVEANINGVKRMVSRKKVDDMGGIENYQIRIAAQEQMERNAHEARDIAERKAALDEQERRIAEKAAAIPAMDSQTGQTPDDLPSDGQNLEELARQYQDAVYEGDDNAPQILTQAMKLAASTGQKFDPNELRQQVKEEVLADQRKSKVVKARQALFDKTPELDKRRPDKFDHRLFQAVDDETDFVERQHPEWEPEDIISKAWENVNKWHGSHKTATMQDKQKDKQELNRPRSATGRQKPPPPPPRKTNSDYVKDQRIARGLDPE